MTTITKLGTFLICRAANLHGLELENLTVLLVLYFTKKREWGCYKTGSWVSWFPIKPNQECRP
jgi:hypothetical protein